MEVHHDEAQRKFWVEVDGFKADMSYHLKEGHLDIRHTLVPEAIGGRGIASMLVKTAYDYARHSVPCSMQSFYVHRANLLAAALSGFPVPVSGRAATVIHCLGRQ